MHDTLPVRLVQRVGDLYGNAERLFRRQRPLPETLDQRLSFQMLHDQVVNVSLVPDIVECADVRMVETVDESAAPDRVHLVLNWFEELKRLVPTESD